MSAFVIRLLTPGPIARLLYLLALLTCSALALHALPELRIDRGDSRLIGKQDPGWAALAAAEKDFGTEQGVLIYLRDDNLWTTARLTAIERLVDAVHELPGISSVSSLLTATHIRDKGRFVDAGPLVDVVPTDAKGLARVRDDALYGPLIKGTYVSADGRATVVKLGYLPHPADPGFELGLYHQIEEILSPLRSQFGQVFQLGWPRINAEIDVGLKRDLRRLVPLAVVVLVAVVTLLLRAPRIVPLPLLTASFTILWTLGFMAATGIAVTMLTAILPALIIVIGAVEDVHLAASFMDGLDGDDGMARQRAVEHMARHVGLAILLTATLNVIGFAANAVSDMPLIREFSLAAAFAMAANLVVTVLVVPTVLVVIGPRRGVVNGTDGLPTGIIGDIVRCVESITTERPAAVLLIMLGGTVALAWQARELEVNNDPVAYFPSDHPLVADVTRLHAELAGLHSFRVVLRSDQPHWFKTVEGLRRIADVQALLDHQALYDSSISLATLMSLMHRELNGGSTAYYSVPSQQADYDLYLSDMPAGQLRSLVTDDFTVAQITVRHNIADSVRLNTAIDELRSLLPALLGPSVHAQLVGKNLMVNRAAESLITGEAQSLALILSVVFLLFSCLFTSWQAGLLALVPSILPIMLNFGVMAALGVPLNPGTAMVAAIAIGLAVDDTIHLMTRFGAESRRLVDEAAAVRATVRGEAVPVITAAAALACGFAIFGLSSFRVVAQFGALAAFTMVYATLCDLLLMPVLLRHLRLATLWDILALEIDRQALRNCTVFADMSDFQIKKLILLAERCEFPAGEVVLRQGEISAGMFVLLSGEVTIDVAQGSRHLVIDRCGPGSIIGEIGFSGGGAPCTANVTAHSPVTAVRLEAERVRKGMRFYPAIGMRLYRNIGNLLGARLRESHARLLAARAAED
jgi:predicted RND superfamily exporter protein/CRP-like cAMP-binding protein